MAAFGKRRSANGSRPHHRPAAKPADLTTAMAAVETGKLPHWTETGPVPFGLAALLALVGFWFLTLPYAGDLLRDYRLAGTWQPAYDMQVVDASCTRYQYILTACDAKIRSLPEPDKAALAVKYMVAFSSGGEHLTPVRSTIDPSAVTIAYPADAKLLNRTLTFFALAGCFAIMFFAALDTLVRGQYAGGPAHDALLANIEELRAPGETAPAGPHVAFR